MRSGLPFQSYEQFRAADIVKRGKLYREIAKLVGILMPCAQS